MKSPKKTVEVTSVQVEKIVVKAGKVSPNIYAEFRGAFVKFVVQVSPLPRVSRTFDLEQFGDGVQWARGARTKLLEEKKPTRAVPPISPIVAVVNPSQISVNSVLDGYRRDKLDQLAGANSESSRLKKLNEWFGHMTLAELRPSVVDKWQRDRLAGLLGSGRVRKTDMTKHQRHYQKLTGKLDNAPEVIAPVSPQTVRHELVLLRRAISSYFEEHQLMLEHGQWLLAQYIMRLKLPERPAPRDTRILDAQLETMIVQLRVPDAQCYVLLAIATTLRRGELCSLRWEDVDFEKCVMHLREPGHYKKNIERQKTKVKARAVPLMPAAIAVLRRLGPKKSGKVFQLTASGYSQAWRRAADRAGLFNIRLHDMRREGISRLIEMVEAPLESVVAFSGHSDVGVLQRHYVKLRPDVIVETLANRAGAGRLLPMAIAEISATLHE